MVNGWRIAISCAIALACGCAVVAGLGDSAHLRDDGTDASTDATFFQPCGLSPSPTPHCPECINTQCCSESIACWRNPRCMQGLDECLKPCAFVDSCVVACLQSYADASELSLLAQCTSVNCVSSCVPAPECRTLGKCCISIPDSGGIKAVHDVCVGTVFRNDPKVCTDYLAERRDAGDCP